MPTTRSLAAGALGGLAGSWLMGYVHLALNRAIGSPPEASDQAQANVRAAVALARAVGLPLRPARERLAGSIMHYAFGTAVGAVYGVASGYSGLARAGAGTAFGATLWLLSEEIAIPVLKLAKPPRAYPLQVHASALAAHLVYGVTADLIRRTLRAAVAR